MSVKLTFSEKQKATKDIKEYPDGTLFHSLTGGYWVKENGLFRWCCSHCRFPRPGGDWDGTVSMPCGTIIQNKEQCQTKEL